MELTPVTEPSWMLEQEVQRRIKAFEADELELQERLEAVRKEKEQALKAKARYARKRPRLDDESSKNADDEQFAPDDYIESDGISAELRALMNAWVKAIATTLPS